MPAPFHLALKVDALQQGADGVPRVAATLHVGDQPPPPRLQRQPAAQVRLPPCALQQVVLRICSATLPTAQQNGGTGWLAAAPADVQIVLCFRQSLCIRSTGSEAPQNRK